MKKLFFLLFFSTSLSHLALAGEPNTSSPATAISILRSSLCPKGPVWVQGVVKEALDTDTYIIEDPSGAIILFLPTAELEALTLKEGKKVLVYGTVDISPARPEKNELYAEKVILFDE